MLLAARHLVDRLRHPRSRADDLDRLRRDLVAAPGPGEASPEEEAASAELAGLRVAMMAAMGEVASCSGCAKGHPLPNGRWSGGHCCGARTEQLFTTDEVAALRLGGTTPGDLTAPRADHAGCAFRGPTGCSLEVADRPSLCVRFVCRELEEELRQRGDLPGIKVIGAAMARALRRFSEARAARLSR